MNRKNVSEYIERGLTNKDRSGIIMPIKHIGIMIKLRCCYETAVEPGPMS